MSSGDGEDVRPSISHSRFGDNTQLLLGKVTNNLTLNLSPEENLRNSEKANIEFLESLGPINPIADKVVFEGINTELPTDGFDWVFDLEQYKNWGAGNGVPVLWIRDETGAGHTPLSLRLLERFVPLTQRDQALIVAYCFCQGGTRINRTITDALQGLLTSIFQQDSHILTHIREKHSKLFQKSSEVDRSGHFIFQKLLTDTLKELVSRGRGVYLIIDGFDNLVANSTGKDADQVLRSLVSQFPSLGWIITSRLPPPRFWTSATSNHPTNELVLSGTGVARGLGLEHAIEAITTYGNGFRSIYKSLSPQEMCSEHLSWFEYTTRGRAWLVQPTVIWYRSTGKGRVPSDLSLQILQTARKWHPGTCRGAYFSFSFVRSPRESTHRPGKTLLLNPTPALWCLFTQLVCEAFSDQDELGLFLSSLPRTQQGALRDICVLVNDLTSSKWLETNLSTKITAEGDNLTSRSADTFEGWVPFEEWVGFLDDSYCQIMCSLLASVTTRFGHSRHTLVIDSMHLADLESWINCLKTLNGTAIGPTVSAGLFLSGAYDVAKESELRIGASLKDAIDEHTEYRECLNQLYFDQIHYRRERVLEALPDTNRWIWQNSAYNEWKNTGGLLWVSGKAGSGKSVLAKTIHRDFLDNLRGGASMGNDMWLVCDWFYSRRDHDIGVAHDSMLRALLHGILHRNEESFGTVQRHYRRAWNSLHENIEGGAWPIGVLEDMLQALSANPSTPKTLAIIDGLDESEDGFNRKKMLRLLVEISLLVRGSIRIIALSRPEPGIEETFNHCLRISMQENNAEDIVRIIDSGLNVMRYFWLRATRPGQGTNGQEEMMADLDNIESSHISNWAKFPPQHNISFKIHEEQELRRIQRYLVHHSAGVTLWARLILEQLVLRVANDADTGFTLLDLRGILKDIPTELNDLYGHILDTLGLSPGSPKQATAERMFRWIVGSISWEPLQLQDFLDAIAIPDNTDTDLFDCEDPIISRRYQIGDNWNRLRKIIFQHCGPLVEILEDNIQMPNHGPGRNCQRVEKAGPTWTLQLIHQTVKTFLETPEHNQLYVDPQEAKRTVLDASYDYLRIVLPRDKPLHLLPQKLNQIIHLVIIPKGLIIEGREEDQLRNMGSVLSGDSESRQSSNDGYGTLQRRGSMRESIILWLEYFANRPFTRYALRILQKDSSRRPKNWILGSIYRGEENGVVLNETFPLWWVVASYIPVESLRQKDYVREFVRYACERGDLISLEVVFCFMDLLQATHFASGDTPYQLTRKQRIWSILLGAIDQLVVTAKAYPQCCYPIANNLFEMYLQNEEMEKLSVTAVMEEDALDNPVAFALSMITLRDPNKHVGGGDLEMTQDRLHDQYCKYETIPNSRGNEPGYNIGVPVWRMDQVITLVLDFNTESSRETGAPPDPIPMPDFSDMDNWIYRVWDGSRAKREPHPDTQIESGLLYRRLAGLLKLPPAEDKDAGEEYGDSLTIDSSGSSWVF